LKNRVSIEQNSDVAEVLEVLDWNFKTTVINIAKGHNGKK
jgi:hypothetical protein